MLEQLPIGLMETFSKLRHNWGIFLCDSPSFPLSCPRSYTSVAFCRLPLPCLLPSLFLSQALLLYTSKSPAIQILREPQMTEKHPRRSSVFERYLVGSKEPLNMKSHDQIWIYKSNSVAEWGMNQWGANGLVKRPLKRQHLLVQGFDKRQLAALIICYVCTLEVNNPHLKNLTETLAQMHKRMKMRMLIVASYVLA